MCFVNKIVIIKDDVFGDWDDDMSDMGSLDWGCSLSFVISVGSVSFICMFSYFVVKKVLLLFFLSRFKKFVFLVLVRWEVGY